MWTIIVCNISRLFSKWKGKKVLKILSRTFVMNFEEEKIQIIVKIIPKWNYFLTLFDRGGRSEEFALSRNQRLQKEDCLQCFIRKWKCELPSVCFIIKWKWKWKLPEMLTRKWKCCGLSAIFYQKMKVWVACNFY